MSKQILIDSYFGLVRTAIAEGNSLLDYYEESPEQGRAKGNIYKGIVKKVDAHIQAAFVRYGGARDAFLPLRESASAMPDGGSVKVGDSILVQVVKDEIGEKGAAVTTKISLSGRYLVFMPARDGEGGISSRITDEERAAMKKAMAELQIPEGGSVILRTAAMNKSASELQADLDRLVEMYREILDLFAKSKEPGLVFREAPPALRYLREYYTPDVDRIWVNQAEVLELCRQFFFLYEPKSAAKVVLSKDGPLMFQKLGLEAEVEKLSARKVVLPSGANIVIDQAEALVAIDVNSAKSRGEGGAGADQLEETAFAINKEAGLEIARQLRLRDLGGIIIADFIDMEEDKHRRQLEDLMRKALASDKAKVKVFDISPLGTMQISRQRLRKAGPNFSKSPCEVCQGLGFHPSPAVGALGLLRKMEERLRGKKSGSGLSVSAPYPVANQLLNDFRGHLLEMENLHQCNIRVTALPVHAGEVEIVPLPVLGEGISRSGKAGEDGADSGARAGEGSARRVRGRGRGAGGAPPAGRTREKRPISDSEKAFHASEPATRDGQAVQARHETRIEPSEIEQQAEPVKAELGNARPSRRRRGRSKSGQPHKEPAHDGKQANPAKGVIDAKPTSGPVPAAAKPSSDGKASQNGKASPDGKTSPDAQGRSRRRSRHRSRRGRGRGGAAGTATAGTEG